MADDVSAQSVLEHNRCVLEDVQLTELIGSGSYAKVYRGTWKGIKVAVKQLHEIFSDSDVEPRQKGGLLGTFYKELEMNMRLRHPNIIQFLGVVPAPRPPVNSENSGRGGRGGGRLGKEGEGFPMMIMELMHCTLEKRLEGYRETGTRMPLCKTIDIASDIAAALVYLHGQEPQPIAHRDLAPKNVLLSAEDTAKLCDLGVAKWAHGSMNNTRGPGTLPYMPPEVLIGTHYAPTAVDIYSFGVALLEMCSGLEPKPKGFVQMAGESEGMLCQMVPERERRAASFGALPPKHPLEPIILKCLELKAESRPTAEQLLSTLLEMKEGEAYLQSKTNVSKAGCPACAASQTETHLLHLQLEEQSRELSRLLEENKTLKKFRDEQLRSLNLQLQATAEEGQKYQRRLQEMQRMLQMQEQMNHELEASNDRAMYFNQLLKQKVEMDNNPSRFSNPPPRPAERGVHSGSVKYNAEHRPKPVPKPRKRMSAVFISGEDSNGLDHTAGSASPRSCALPLTRVSSDPELGSRQQSNYLQLIVGTPVGKPPAVPIDKMPNHFEKQQSDLTVLPQSRGSEASDYAVPLVTLTKPGASVKMNPPSAKPQVNHEAKPSEVPLLNGGHRSTKTDCSDDLDDHIYVTIPPRGPPTPPPRVHKRFDLHRATWHAAPPPRPKQLGPIVERDESLVSPHPTGTTPDWVRPVRMAQSMKIKGGPFRGDSQHLVHETPNFFRQGSRGDVLISRVLNTIKSRNPLELSVTKGELVKVTNNAMDKKWCTAVTTTGRYGSLKKKAIEELEPVAILYNGSNPALSRRRGVINHIALCSSMKSTPFSSSKNTWISPVDANRITITPSSLHSGEVNFLVKMTDYLLCCTDSEEGSHFEIDLHEQRLLKLSGYVLQCHQEGHNGAPQKWRLDGSHNGTTWNTLSEEEGDFFHDGKTANYFSVTNPTPCRYFRLTQLEKNSFHNYRFCLSGIELFGFLYSSFAAERFSYRIY